MKKTRKFNMALRNIVDGLAVLAIFCATIGLIIIGHAAQWVLFGVTG